MRSPFTGIVFALELTHDVNMFLPLLVAAVHRALLHRADAKRSILTEKVAAAAITSAANTQWIRWRCCSSAR